MQTQIHSSIKSRPEGQEAEAILRKCVHCGFCLATCPTYTLTGNELDSPRGRIYLIKQLLEGHPVTEHTQKHLDSCLNCRSCETTCPANVTYHRLLEISAPIVEEHVKRTFKQNVMRTAILNVLPYKHRFAPLLRGAQWIKPLLPERVTKAIPTRQNIGSLPVAQQARTVLMLEGCVQSSIAPEINAAAARVLDAVGISTIYAPKAGCCGALSYHLDQQQDGLDFMRRNIDAWWPYLQQGCEAIVITASGCGTTIKEYASLLKTDIKYAEKAAQVSALAKDLVEVLSNEAVEKLPVHPNGNVAFQCPCSLQHGQGLAGSVESLLQRMGFDSKPIQDNHICCGSAGTYSIFQPKMANELRERKVQSLKNTQADHYTSANIGCIAHLSASSDKPIRHWIQAVDEALNTTT